RSIKTFFKFNKLSEKVMAVDPSFFPLLGIQLKQGSLAEFESNPYAVILTETAAEKLFGKEVNPIHQFIDTENLNKPVRLEVVGVIRDISAFSTIQSSYFISTKYIETTQPRNRLESWGMVSYETYIEVPNL